MDLGDSTLQPVRLLGEGNFGRVFLCKNRKDYSGKQFVCVKRIIVQDSKLDIKMIQEEIYIISQLNHPLIVQFIRSYMHHGTVNIVMEYCCNGTLRTIIEHHNARNRSYSMPISHMLFYFCDILMGLEYLHIRHVIHRDLKPENLLIDAHCRIKITDFGISVVHNTTKQRLDCVGTPQYMAPEAMHGERCDFKSDIWSLGVILYELCIGHAPFVNAQTWNDLKYLIYTMTREKFYCPEVTTRVGNNYAILCERMVCYDKSNRIALSDILRINVNITKAYYRQYFDYH